MAFEFSSFLATLSSNVLDDNHLVLGVIQASEADFLHLGDQIQICARGSSSFKNQLSILYDSILGADGNAPLYMASKLLNAHLSELDSMQGMLKNGIKHLMETQSGMAHLMRECATMLQQANYFSVLGLNIRIQAIAIPGAEIEFNAVSTTTRKIGVDIQAINREVQDVGQRAIQSMAQTKMSCDKELLRIREGLKENTRNLASLNESTDLLRQSARRGWETVRESSLQITQQISSLVMDVQFHDRLSQRMEHTTASLLDCVAFLRQAQNGDNATASWHELGVARTLVRLQIDQVNDELERIKTTCNDGAHSLKELSDSIEKILDALHSNISVEKRGGFLNVIKNMESLFSDNETIQNVAKQALINAMDRIRENQESIQNVRSKLQTIDNWKSKARVLSFNAIILAGKFGASGAGLAAISQEIVKTSMALSTVVERIQVASNLVNSNSEYDLAEQDSGEANQALVHIHSLANCFSEHQNRVDSGEYQELKLATHKAIDSLHGMNVLIEEIERYRGRLVSYEADLLRLLPDTSIVISESESLLQKVFSRYTMDDERQVFNRYFGKSGDLVSISTSDDNCELF